MSKDNENDDCGFELNLADLSPESDFYTAERWPYKDFMRALDETSRAMDKTVAEMIPLLCRKYKVGEAFIRLVLAKATLSACVILEAERLGLTDDNDIGDCIRHMTAVMEEHRRQVEE